MKTTKPIDIIAEMLVTAVKSHSSHESISVVFLIMSRVIGELPGDNSVLIKWMDQSILSLSHGRGVSNEVGSSKKVKAVSLSSSRVDV